MPKYNFNSLKGGYKNLYDTMVVSPQGKALTNNTVKRVLKDKQRYLDVQTATGVDWIFIALTHNMECSGDFTKHLYNGDPLTARTVRVPAGLPKEGNPPFTWETSAVGALKHKGLDKFRPQDWTIELMLYQCEGFNGYGYRGRGINSPYLWSMTNHYTKGKYVKDGVYDVNAVSEQLGCAVLINALKNTP
jgi:lysozyme family protein